jgi:hypothetical protein
MGDGIGHEYLVTKFTYQTFILLLSRVYLFDRWHCDMQRQFGQRNAIVIDVGAYPLIGMTPGHGDLGEVEILEGKLRQLCFGSNDEGFEDDSGELIPRSYFPTKAKSHQDKTD